VNNVNVQFQVGDRVRVTGKTEDFAPHGMGPNVAWDNEWVDEMEAQIGREYTIACVHPSIGATFEEDQDLFNYAFPLSSLEKLQLEKELNE